LQTELEQQASARAKKIRAAIVGTGSGPLKRGKEIRAAVLGDAIRAVAALKLTALHQSYSLRRRSDLRSFSNLKRRTPLEAVIPNPN
jgi:hypothetical protein